MVDDVPEEPPRLHVSYSSLNKYLECGKRYQLEKVLNLPEKPAWWNKGGRAVHASTEVLDREQFELVGY